MTGHGVTFSPGRARALRESRHLNPAALAARIGTSTEAVEQHERGGVRPDDDALARALGVTVSDLFDVDPGDPRQRYIQAVCDLLPPMTEGEVAEFGAVVRARRTTVGQPDRVSA